MANPYNKITINISAEQDSKLIQLAKRDLYSKSAAVRIAIRDFLEKFEVRAVDGEREKSI